MDLPGFDYVRIFAFMEYTLVTIPSRFPGE